MQWRGSKSNLQDFIQDSLIEKIGLTLRSHTMLFKPSIQLRQQKVDSILKTLQNEVYDNYISTSVPLSSTILGLRILKTHIRRLFRNF
jgi:hypothetical protein